MEIRKGAVTAIVYVAVAGDTTLEVERHHRYAWRR